MYVMAWGFSLVVTAITVHLSPNSAFWLFVPVGVILVIAGYVWTHQPRRMSGYVDWQAPSDEARRRWIEQEQRYR